MDNRVAFFKSSSYPAITPLKVKISWSNIAKILKDGNLRNRIEANLISCIFGIFGIFDISQKRKKKKLNYHKIIVTNNNITLAMM
jgi:DNA gyrase/topoisomerase IV subunit B